MTEKKLSAHMSGDASIDDDGVVTVNGKLPYYIATGAWAGYHTVEADHGLTIFNPATGAFSGFFVVGGVGSFYVQNNTGSIWMSLGGSLTGTSRFYMGGSHAFEFDHTPYVGNSPMWHAGVNKLPAQADSTATTVAEMRADHNALLAKLRAAEIMNP